ncbi:MAG TPA: hypothetical protein VNB90_06010 [Cytophagaceae bacterium]|nr:hypothetical protein [Cytophagaceae bacterium]
MSANFKYSLILALALDTNFVDLNVQVSKLLFDDLKFFGDLK